LLQNSVKMLHNLQVSENPDVQRQTIYNAVR